MVKRWAFVSLTILSLLFTTCSCAGDISTDEKHSGTAPTGTVIEDIQCVAQNGDVSLWVDGQTSEIIIQNKSNEILWRSFPAMGENELDFGPAENRNSLIAVTTADYYNNLNVFQSASGSVELGGMSCRQIKDGVKIWFDFPEEGQQFTVPVSFTLKDGQLYAEIHFDEIDVRGDTAVVTINLMPYFGAARKEDEGYILLPDGGGALLEYALANKEAEIYNEPVYGTDPAMTYVSSTQTEESIRLPLYGVRKNGNAFLAVIEQGAAMANIVAAQPGRISSFSNAYVQFIYTVRDTYTIADKDYNAQTVTMSATHPSTVNPRIRYMFLPPDSDYTDMATAYRDYLIESGMTRTEQTVSPVVLSVYGGAQEEDRFVGIPYKKLKTATTLEQVEEMLRQLNDGGVDSIYTVLYGFGKKGMNASDQHKLTFDRAFGGQAAFDKLQQTAASLNDRIFPVLDFVNTYQRDKSSVARRVTETYVEDGYIRPNFGTMEGNRWFLRSPLISYQLAETYFKNTTTKSDVFLSDIGDRLLSDYNSKRYILRNKAEQLYRDIAGMAGASEQQVMVDGGNLYALYGADIVLNIPTASSRFDVITAEVPFYSMALHGLKTLVSEPINAAYDPEELFLQSAALGNAAHFRLTWDTPYVLARTCLNGIMDTEFSLWKDDVIRWCERLRELNDLNNQYIVSYEKAEGYSVTEFEDGSKVYVNYTDTPLTVDGITINEKDFLRVNRVA